MGRQAVGAILPPGPFDGSPVLCYAQKPLCAATVPGTTMEIMKCEQSMEPGIV